MDYSHICKYVGELYFEYRSKVDSMQTIINELTKENKELKQLLDAASRVSQESVRQ